MHDVLSHIAALEALVKTHGPLDVLWQDPATGQLCPVQVQAAIHTREGKARVYFALLPLVSAGVQE
jgi:hypothetical protein